MFAEVVDYVVGVDTHRDEQRSVSTPASFSPVEPVIPVRDLRGMTGGREVVLSLGQPQNMLICSPSRTRVSGTGSARDGSEGRRSFAPVPGNRSCRFAGNFYGSDGTRTRDLRRDRPVLAIAD
jgi:hypothetical protein